MPPLDDACLVGEVGEEALLAAFTPLLPTGGHALVGNGDDCAVLAASDGRYCVSTDLLVEGHHFDRAWSTPEQVGARAAAQNLADVAAMGAVPTAVVVGLVLPPSTTVGWVRGLARGLGAACRACGAGVVGGDLSAGEQLVVSVTVHGDLQGRAPLLRDGARPGDLLVHAGDLGRSAAGLALLRAGISGPEQLGPQASPQVREAVAWALAGFRSPTPPLGLGPALARAGARAMMDVSDSLLRDAGRLARASGVRLDLDDPCGQGSWLAGCRRRLEVLVPLLHQAPGPGALTASEAGPEPVRGAASEAVLTTAEVARTAAAWVLTGGEDHGLLAAVPAGSQEVLPAGVRVLGRVLEHVPGTPSVTVGGEPWQGAVGWDHFEA